MRKLLKNYTIDILECKDSERGMYIELSLKSKFSKSRESRFCWVEEWSNSVEPDYYQPWMSEQLLEELKDWIINRIEKNISNSQINKK
jgi:hypothetical protein